MANYDSNSSQENSGFPIEGIWKPTKYGEWARFEDIVALDPNLKEILKPEQGFKVVYKGYKYTIKVNSDDFIVVFRSNTLKSSDSDSKLSSQLHASNSLSNDRQLIQLTKFHNQEVCKIRRMKIIDIKVVKLGQLPPEEQWEIYDREPIVVIKEEPYVILVRFEDKAL